MIGYLCRTDVRFIVLATYNNSANLARMEVKFYLLIIDEAAVSVSKISSLLYTSSINTLCFFGMMLSSNPW